MKPVSGMQPIDSGRRYRTVRFGRIATVRVHARSAVISVILIVVAAIVAVLSLGIGDYSLSPAQVVQALTGQGRSFHRLIVLEWRLPTVLAAILFGALPGVGGAIFQSLTRNPLGSPDVVGFDAGSYTGVVVVVLLIGANQYWYVAAASFAGGLLTAVVVYLLAPALRQLELGDDAALAQGVNASVARPLLLVVGVATTALVTAAAGPIGFIALSAPQLARRVTRTPGVSVWPAACMGAALLALAQLFALVIAQVYHPVPVGLITVGLGGLYLIWLLIREARKGM